MSLILESTRYGASLNAEKLQSGFKVASPRYVYLHFQPSRAGQERRVPLENCQLDNADDGTNREQEQQRNPVANLWPQATLITVIAIRGATRSKSYRQTEHKTGTKDCRLH